jgi:Dyp-type peroxidase family
MPINLNDSLSWKSADADVKALLDDLQGNILKGHGRDHTKNLFLHFPDPVSGRQFLSQLALMVTSSQKQLEDAERFKQTGESGGAFVGIYLSAAGYGALGVDPAKLPVGDAFQKGLKNRREALNDPEVKDWDPTFRAVIHAMVLLAHDNRAALRSLVAQVRGMMPPSAQILGEETGLAMRNENGDGIEHFGYVDGRSQPLALKEDVRREQQQTDGISVWNPEHPLKNVLVPDPGGKLPHAFGSYFVFRKLEQNVKGFKEAEEQLAKDIGLNDTERAGAMVVGRFEDGTPPALQKAEGSHSPVPNNFTYDDDKLGAKCPFHAHIRKMNPRGESPNHLPTDVEQERSHMIFRRGITFGERPVDEKGNPEGGVGLLFMCFQASIENQFEFMQKMWANNSNFVKPSVGIDPVIGQARPGELLVQQTWPTTWGGTKDAEAHPVEKQAFSGFVKMKGGEYFFAPSISLLKQL